MPLIDGGSRITNYIVEKRESTRKAYSTVTTNCQKCSFRIPNLAEGCEYYFRVLAENEYGIGEPAETTEPVRASEAPSPPESLNIMDVTRNSVSLAWPKPEHDGGSKITGYVIEAQRKGTNQWAHITTVKTLDCVVKNLTENEEYTFQVMAVNSAGRSAPRESRPVIIKEQTMLPEFDLRGIYQKTVIAKAGDNIKIEIPVLGRPRPTVTWKKEDQILKQTQRVNYENTATATILTINECKRSDSGQYPLSAKNIVGEVSEVITVQVHDIPGPPTGPIKFDEISSDFLTFSWEPPLNDGGVPISNYVVEMRQTDSTTWTELATTVIRTTFKATRLTTGVEYQFRVKAQNRYGIGPAITSESIVANYPFKVPGPPGTPQVIAVTKETMTISWNEPVTDGGSPILGYHVERKERNSILWQTVSKMLVSGNIFKSTGLTDGIAYEFRVIAENLAGKSKPSKPSEPVFALDPIDPPGKPIPLNITRHAVTLKWTKPEYNGGFKITGYTVEKRDLPNGRWLKANFSNILETEFTVSGLTEDAAYEFRVIARNAGGAVSQPSEPSDAITCRDDIEAPKIRVDVKYKDTLVLKAGEVFRLEADVSGRPPPTMTWTKGEKELEGTAKLEIKIADFSTVLVNKDSSRRDGGAYTLTATNPGGFAKHIFNVKVLDRPGPPEGPLAVSEVTAEKCVLSWLPPLDDGGAKIDHYVVEKRETSRLAWTVVATEVPLTKLKVTKLLKGNEYVFRVMAVNKYGYGIGLPVETSESVKVSERPLPPGKITLLDVTRNSVTLSWEKPEHDGGSRILGYIVEMQSKGSEKWSTCATVKVTEATITGLIQGEEYTFRVSAQNEKGISDPRQLGIPVVAKDLVIPPAFKLLFTTFSVLAGEDLKVDVPFVGRPKPAVFWHKDNVALKQTTRVNAESSENNTVLTIKEACREDVGTYLVKLTNSAGEATETLNIVVLDKPGPPTGPVKVDEVTADSITISWEPPKYDGGSSINNYIVEKRDTSTTTWQIVSATVARTTIKACRLKTGCEYQFRIAAENRYGKSTYLTSDEPSESSGAITARDEVEPPHISMDPKYKDTIVVHAGESFKLDADVHGKPIPSIQWLKGDHELTNTARMEIKSTDFATSLSVKEATRVDSGQYILLAKNVAGIAYYGRRLIRPSFAQLTSKSPPSALALSMNLEFMQKMLLALEKQVILLIRSLQLMLVVCIP
uniref:Titin n=1 Tax=Calidris pygmaea TaxID=425635 RepID=A0A8C3KGS5_9CHAR